MRLGASPPPPGLLEGVLDYAEEHPYRIVRGLALSCGCTLAAIVVAWRVLRLHQRNQAASRMQSQLRGIQARKTTPTKASKTSAALAKRVRRRSYATSQAQWSRYSWVRPPPQWPPAAFTASGILMQNLPGLILLLALLSPLSAVPLLVAKLLDILINVYRTFAFLQRPVERAWELASIHELVALCVSVRASALGHLAIVLAALFGNDRALAIEDALESNAGGLLTLGSMILLPIATAIGLLVLPKLVPLASLLLSKIKHMREAEAEKEHVRLQRERRDTFAALIARAASRAPNAVKFNEFVAGIRGISLYGCGVLAPAHVGAIRALERHGFQSAQLETIAGVSSGACVAALLAVGYSAEEVCEKLVHLHLSDLIIPEPGSLLRLLSALVFTAFKALSLDALLPSSSLAAVERLVLAAGPGGVTAGSALEAKIRSALADKCGDGMITLGEVHSRFGRRLVIITTEIDTCKERQLTPETNPDLPLAVAVRMSMGVPVLMEPYKLDGHYYVDGGLMNDFPLDAVPAETRIGLMVRPGVWFKRHLDPAKVAPTAVRHATPRHAAALRATIAGMYRTRNFVELLSTMLQAVMESNVAMQVIRSEPELGRGASACGHYRGEIPDVLTLAPEILTLCAGSCDPFEFSATSGRLTDVYQSSQLNVHLYAALHDPSTSDAVMSEADRLEALLHVASVGDI